MIGPDPKVIALKPDEQLKKLNEVYTNAAKEKVAGAPAATPIAEAPVVEPLPTAAPVEPVPEVAPAAPEVAPVQPAEPVVQDVFGGGFGEAPVTEPTTEIPADSAANLFDEPTPDVAPEAPVNPFDIPVAETNVNMFDVGETEQAPVEANKEPEVTPEYGVNKEPEATAINLFDEPAPEVTPAAPEVAPEVTGQTVMEGFEETPAAPETPEAPVVDGDIVTRLDALQKSILEAYMELDAIKNQLEAQKTNENTMHM